MSDWLSTQPRALLTRLGERLRLLPPLLLRRERKIHWTAGARSPERMSVPLATLLLPPTPRRPPWYRGMGLGTCGSCGTVK